jgi:hypothetical protein
MHSVPSELADDEYRNKPVNYFRIPRRHIVAFLVRLLYLGDSISEPIGGFKLGRM